MTDKENNLNPDREAQINEDDLNDIQKKIEEAGENDK